MKLPLVVLLFALALPAPAFAGGAGAYAGSGPSRTVDADGACVAEADAQLVLRGPAAEDGTWALDLHSTSAGLFALNGCEDSLLATSWWPSTDVAGLRGSPETGFVGEGIHDNPLTISRDVAWRLEMGPIGDATPWKLELWWVGGDSEIDYVWTGVVDFRGAHA